MYKELSEEETKLHQEFFLDVIKTMSKDCDNKACSRLPFFHTCKGEYLRSIFSSKFITPSMCKIFKKDLTYLFYGKPSYRVPDSTKSTRDAGRFPVSFVIDLKRPSIEHLFPFDTGALVNEKFKDICDSVINPAKYELGKTIDDLKNFVYSFYNSDKNYHQTKPVINIDSLKPFSFELQRVLRLINESSDKDYDNRAYTVELQITNQIEFAKPSIKAILLPSLFMEDENFAEYLYNNDIEAITYSIEQSNPAHMTTLLLTLASDYLERENIL